MRSFLRIAATAASLLLILSACASGSAPVTSIKITLTEFSFVPNTFTVPAGQQIKIAATNSGAVAHDFMIMNHGQELTGHGMSGTDSHSGAYWALEQIPPGERVQAEFTAPDDPGEYQIACGVPGHLDAGMIGKLIVVAP